jgi:hypothetical protein
VIEKSIQRHEAENRDETRNSSDHTAEVSEVSLLRLELNDVSCGLASGVGFGFMHTVMLYGTLLASENNRIGTLYQESCTAMPSIFNSALMAFMFGVLDIVWMMLSFYGMRRLNSIGRTSEWSFAKGHVGGKAALAFVFTSHLAASFATLSNEMFSSNGCYVALPVLATITIVTTSLAWIYCNETYLPEGQKDRIRQVRHLD